jgi:hypothetical protein
MSGCSPASKTTPLENLPAFFFLEPSWSSTGNCQHLKYNVARGGEQLLLDTYRAVAEGPTGPTTLLIVIYDAAASTSSPGHRYPDDSIGEHGFDFTRFGPRRPTRLGQSAGRVGNSVPGARIGDTIGSHQHIWPPSSTAGHYRP